MRKPVRVFIVLAIIVLVILGLRSCAQRSSTKTALAKYKAELRGKGEKLTFDELGYPRVPESSDSLNQLVTALNQIGTAKLEPGSLELLHFVSAGRARLSWTMAQPPLSSSWRGNTNLATWESFSAQFETAADSMQAVRAVVQNPPRRFFNDPTNLFNQPAGPFIHLRKATQWLTGDAIAALHAGQLDRAQADLHALTQLAQFHREDLTLVSQMIRTAISGLGLVVTWEALQAQGWNDESLAALQKDWEAVDLADAYEKGIIGERAGGEAVFANMRSVGAGERMKFFRFGTTALGPRTAKDYYEQWVLMPLWLANSDADETFFLEYHQRFLESFRKIRNPAAWPAIESELRSQGAEREKAFSIPLAKLRLRFSAVGIPNSVRAAQVCVRNETQRRLTVTAIALERYRLRNGHPAPDLDALVPQFLSAVPLDLMSAKPLRYRLDADGSFALYSVGEDGRDDAGDPNPQVVTNKFDLWLGKDAVWPAPLP